MKFTSNERKDLRKQSAQFLPRNNFAIATVVQQQGGVGKVRPACVNAPSLNQPLGVKSRDYLRSLLAQANNHVILTIADTDRQGRKVAEVNVPIRNADEEKGRI